MDKAILDGLYSKAQEIAKETADKLMQYHRSVAEIYYSSNPLSIDVSNVGGEHEDKIKSIAEKFNEFQEQAKARAEFAPADKIKQANEMETIIREGNERIKKLYNDAINSQNQPL